MDVAAMAHIHIWAIQPSIPRRKTAVNALLTVRPIEYAHENKVRGEAMRDLTRRVQAEYAEMPGLSVTLPQAQRLLAIDAPTCTAVFGALIKSGVLRRTPEGRFVRAR